MFLIFRGGIVRLEGREWRVVVSEVRLGADRYRVIKPQRPTSHMSLYEGRLGAQMSVDRRTAVDFAIAWWLATRSPRSLVYLPLRSSGSDCGAEYNGRKLDLVLLHHSLGFRASRWKQVRSHVSGGKPHKVTIPARAFPKFGEEVHLRRRHRDFRDELRWTIAADTLFLIGSRSAFEMEGDQVRGLAEDCPAHLAERPETHCCAEIGIGSWSRRDRRNPWAELHVECCNRHW